MAHKTRPRLVYPDLFDSEKFGGLEYDATWGWLYLLTHADDDGRGQFNLSLFAVVPFIRSPKSPDEARAICDQLSTSRLVDFYEADGRAYYQMHDWADFQRVRKDRYQPSTYPVSSGSAVTTAPQPSDNQPGASRSRERSRTTARESSANCSMCHERPAREGKQTCLPCAIRWREASDADREQERRAREAMGRGPSDLAPIAPTAEGKA